jgi:hypothetical protein
MDNGHTPAQPLKFQQICSSKRFFYQQTNSSPTYVMFQQNELQQAFNGFASWLVLSLQLIGRHSD